MEKYLQQGKRNPYKFLYVIVTILFTEKLHEQHNTFERNQDINESAQSHKHHSRHA